MVAARRSTARLPAPLDPLDRPSRSTCSGRWRPRSGHTAVEAQQHRYGGVGRPSATTSFLTSRQFRRLKATAHPTHAQRYLRDVIVRLPTPGKTAWALPLEIDSIEWIGAPADLYPGLRRPLVPWHSRARTSHRSLAEDLAQRRLRARRPDKSPSPSPAPAADQRMYTNKCSIYEGRPRRRTRT